MKKMMCLLISYLVITLSVMTSCNDYKNNNLTSNGWAEISEIYSQEYNQMIFNFSQIMKEAAQVSSGEDIDYLDGRISEYLLTDRLFNFSRFNDLDDSLTIKIVDKDLKEPIRDLSAEIDIYLEKLKKRIIDMKNIGKMKEMKNDFVELSGLLDNINFDGYNNKEYEDLFIETIDAIREKLKNDISKYLI